MLQVAKKILSLVFLSQVTWTDLFIVATLTSILVRCKAFHIPENCLDDYEKLKALVNRVQELPAIAKWLKERPVTEM